MPNRLFQNFCQSIQHCRKGLGVWPPRSTTTLLLASLSGGAAIVTWDSPRASAQVPTAATTSPYYTDPATGIVYRKVHRTIERPTVETQIQPQESTVYRPETVVEVRPETRTVYRPVVSYGWEPVVRNRWNPFAQPTLQYEHTPRTHWEARSETVEHRQTRTNWVAEHRRVDVPQQVVKIQREEKVDYEPIGRVAPSQATPPNSADAALAARLRPLNSGAAVAPLPAGGYSSGPALASSFGEAARRSSDQVGLRATDLQSSGYSSTLPLPPAPIGVARTPLMPLWR